MPTAITPALAQSLDQAFDKICLSAGLYSNYLGQSFSSILNSAITGGGGSDVLSTLTLTAASNVVLSVHSDAWVDFDGAAVGGAPVAGMRWNSGQSALQIQQTLIGPSAGGVNLGSSSVPFFNIYSNNNIFANIFACLTTSAITLEGQTPNGSTAVGVILNNTNALTTAGAKLVSFRSNNVEKSFVDKDGGVNVSGARVTFRSDGSNYLVDDGLGTLITSSAINVATIATIGGSEFNAMNLNGSTTGNPVTIAAVGGGDTDVGIKFIPKGAGGVGVNSGTKLVFNIDGTSGTYIEDLSDNLNLVAKNAIVFNSDNGITYSNNIFSPLSDNALDLGQSGFRWKNLYLSGKVNSYNALTTAGVGVSPILQSVVFSLSASSGLTSFAVTANGVFEVGGYLNVTSYSSGSIHVNVGYADVRGGTHSVPMLGSDGSGNTQNSLSGTGIIQFNSQTITAGTGTNITSALTITGTAACDVYFWLKQIA